MSIFDLTDNKMTPLEIVVLESANNANEIIRHFKQNYSYYKDELSIQEQLDLICSHLGLKDGDLLTSDITRVRETIEEWLENGIY